MRLVGRWFWASVAISGCFSCFLLLGSNNTLHRPTHNPPPSSPEVSLTSQRTAINVTPVEMISSSIATFGRKTILSSKRTSTSLKTKTTTPLAKPTTEIFFDYRSSCWKAGFSPASGKPTNHTPNEFIISESRLCNGPVLLLVLVHSEISARPRRDLARRTWASFNNINGRRLAVTFIVGTTVQPALQAAAREESAETADLLQVPCQPDGHPKSASCKALYSMLWASRNCPGAQFIMKVDDNAFVNVFQVVALLTGRLSGAVNTFYCRTAAKESRSLDKKYLWSVSQEEWPVNEYPLHCKGLAYIMSGDLAPRLLQCAAWRNYLRLEDVFVTGVLGGSLGARMIHWTSGWDSEILHPKHDGPDVSSSIVLVSHEGAPLPNLQRRVWKAALLYSADIL